MSACALPEREIVLVSKGIITLRMEKNRGDRYAYPPLLPILAETIAASKAARLDVHRH